MKHSLGAAKGQGQRRDSQGTETPRVEGENDEKEAAHGALTKLLKMVQVQPLICGAWLCTGQCRSPRSPVPAAAPGAPSITKLGVQILGDGRGSGRAAAGEANVSSLTAVPRGVQGTKAAPGCVCEHRPCQAPQHSWEPPPAQTRHATAGRRGCHCHWHLRARCQMPRKRQGGLSRELQQRLLLPAKINITDKRHDPEIAPASRWIAGAREARNGKDE